MQKKPMVDLMVRISPEIYKKIYKMKVAERYKSITEFIRQALEEKLARKQTKTE